MSDAQERTEQATEKHLKEVRLKGMLQKSRDLSAWVSVGAGAVMIPSTLARAQSTAETQVFGLRDIIADPTTEGALGALGSAFAGVCSAVWPMLLVVALASIVATVAQGGIHLKRFELKFDHFNPVNGLTRLFGPRTGWEAVKTLAKAALVGAGFYMVMQAWIPVLLQSGGLSLQALLGSAESGVWTLLRTAIAAGLIFSGFDVFVVIRRNLKASRMTKRQVKDENKNTEGDPLVRAHRRSRQLTMSRSRMIASIADADVVIVNPTHVAVALSYDPGKSAPRVVAKGADLVATRIREEAVLHGVPMVQDIPLARALYKQCELGQEIPVDTFTAVAQVLAFVMALKKRGASLNDVYTVPVPRARPRPAPARPMTAPAR
jgi:flagellar biosynthetic protein FlhB